MDSSPSEASAQTLSQSHSSSSGDRSSSPPSSDPSPALSKTSSFSKLNAQAPEFVPRTSSSASLAASSASSSPLLSPTSLSSLPSPSSPPGNFVSLTQQQSDLAASFVIPRPPAPPALVHVYNTTTQVPPLEGHYGYGYGVQYYGGLGGSVDRQQDLSVLAASVLTHPPVLPPTNIQVNSEGTSAVASLNNGLSEEAAQKLMKQVEFYFSDVNLATTGYLFKIMCKDPEGYVPISVVASIKKIKTLTKCQSQLAGVLRGSSKLVVSDDGKKVRRQQPLTETDMEDVQSRIVIAENLPEDHCHQNLMRIFSAVGSVKSIRTCQPGGPSSTSKASKADSVNFSNKLHTFVEYETSELAEKAVAELNEGNWRNGLKVRLLLKHSTKSGQARVKRGGHEAELNFKEEDAFAPEQQEISEIEDSMQLPNEPIGEEHSHDKDGGGSRKGRSRETGESRNWGKGRGRQPHNVNNRGTHAAVTSNVTVSVEQSVGKQPSVPRMPDGTRGFSMGRGKPVAVRIA